LHSVPITLTVLAAFSVLVAGYGFVAGMPAATAADAHQPLEAAGRVTNSAAKDSRQFEIQAGPLEVTVNAPKEAAITAKGRSISVHKIKPGMYVWARGVRSGNARMVARVVQVIGDRYDFMKSKYARVNGEKGFVRRAATP
jgi:hypothetical protein